MTARHTALYRDRARLTDRAVSKPSLGEEVAAQ
jgi:hypothetical protein